MKRKAEQIVSKDIDNNSSTLRIIRKPAGKSDINVENFEAFDPGYEGTFITDETTQKKFHITDKSEVFDCLEFHFGNNLCGIKEERFIYELAVLGGNLFKLLLGQKQPSYYLGIANKGNEQRIYRLSKFVEIEEPVYYKNTNSKLLLNLFEPNKGPNLSKPPMVGVILLLMVSAFLGDSDFKNFGMLKDKDINRAIRYDPEFCFSHYFWHTDENDIREMIFYLADPESDNENKYQFSDKLYTFMDSLLRKNGHELFWSDSFDDDSDDDQPFLDILYTEWKRFEAYAALARIFEIYPQFFTLIHTQISEEYSPATTNLINHLKNRVDIFKCIANQLPHFQHFYSEYLNKKSPIHIFWHKYFGDYQPAPEEVNQVEPYVCYEPAESMIDKSNLAFFKGKAYQKTQYANFNFGNINNNNNNSNNGNNNNNNNNVNKPEENGYLVNLFKF